MAAINSCWAWEDSSIDFRYSSTFTDLLLIYVVRAEIAKASTIKKMVDAGGSLRKSRL